MKLKLAKEPVKHRLQRIESFHRVIEQSIKLQTDLTTNKDINEAFVLACSGAEIDPASRSMLENWLGAIFSTFWQVHYYYAKGTLEEDIYQADKSRYAELVLTPFFNHWWNRNKQKFSTSFQCLIQEMSGGAPDMKLTGDSDTAA